MALTKAQMKEFASKLFSTALSVSGKQSQMSVEVTDENIRTSISGAPAMIFNSLAFIIMELSRQVDESTPLDVLEQISNRVHEAWETAQQVEDASMLEFMDSPERLIEALQELMGIAAKQVKEEKKRKEEPKTGKFS